MKRAIICGVSGQDGAYLAQLLLKRGYVVCGTSRDAQMSSFRNLKYLGIEGQVQLESMALTDFRSVLQVLTKFQPDEVYNLAGQTSVGLSFEQPVETLESIATGTLNLLEAIRFLGAGIKLYNAGSSALGVLGALRRMRRLRLGRGVLMLWRRRRLFGRWLIIGRLIGCLLVRGFCLIMSRRCGLSGL
jgi:GDP-D-mannose dehydratase